MQHFLILYSPIEFPLIPVDTLDRLTEIQTVHEYFE